MSELIEKVHGAVLNYCAHSGPPIQGRPCGMCDAITRAAIAAVAEWLDNALKDDDGRIYVPQFLRNKLEQPK